MMRYGKSAHLGAHDQVLIPQKCFCSISIEDALLTSQGIAMRGDGLPFWTEGRTAKPAIDATEAARRRRNLANALTHVDGDARGHALGLAQRLQACSNYAPCLSAACPICWRAARRLLVGAVQSFFPPGQFTCVTCVSASDTVPYGSLNDLDALWGAKRRLLGLLQRNGMRAFGGIDIVAVEHQTGAFAPCWVVHPHTLIYEEPFERHRACFENAYCRKGAVFKPVDARTFDGRTQWLAYSIDMPTRKRVSYPPRITSVGKRKRRNTKKRDLPKKRRVELAMLLDRAGFDARLIMFGYELFTDGSRVWASTVHRQRAEELVASERVDQRRHSDQQTMIRQSRRQAVLGEKHYRALFNGLK